MGSEYVEELENEELVNDCMKKKVENDGMKIMGMPLVISIADEVLLVIPMLISLLSCSLSACIFTHINVLASFTNHKPIQNDFLKA